MALPEALQRNHFLARPRRHRLRIIFIPLDRLRLAHVQILMPQRQSVRTIQTGNQLFAFTRLVPVPLAQRHDVYDSGRAFGRIAQQQFAARSLQHVPRPLETLRVDVHRKTCRRVQLRARRLRNHVRTIVDGWGGVRRRQFHIRCIKRRGRAQNKKRPRVHDHNLNNCMWVGFSPPQRPLLRENPARRRRRPRGHVQTVLVPVVLGVLGTAILPPVRAFHHQEGGARRASLRLACPGSHSRLAWSSSTVIGRILRSIVIDFIASPRPPDPSSGTAFFRSPPGW
jgi:hypothetical protein